MLPNDIVQMLGGAQGVAGLDPAAAELIKALTTGGFQTDFSQYVQGNALRGESLDTMIARLVPEVGMFVLWQNLPKQQAAAVSDQWTEQYSVGGEAGTGPMAELDVLQEQTGLYRRRVGEVKILGTLRRVSVLQNLIPAAFANAITEEEHNGSIELMQSIESYLFEGDKRVNPLEFDGLAAQIEQYGAEGAIIDLAFDPAFGLDASGFSTADHLAQATQRAARIIAQRPNFGVASHVYMGFTPKQDLDMYLSQQYRVILGAQMQTLTAGTPVEAIATSFGVQSAAGSVRLVPDRFIRDADQLMPAEVRGEHVAAAVTPPPSAVAATAGAPSPGVTSKFTADWAGNYRYFAEAVGRGGTSQVVAMSGVVAVGAGQVVNVAITNPPGDVIYYRVYRTKLDAAGTAPADEARLIGRVAKAAGATTTFVDTNQRLPGSTDAFVLNLSPGYDAISWRSLAGFTKFTLYPTNSLVLPFAIYTMGYLRVKKARQHAWIRNYVPRSGGFTPA